MRLIPIRIAFMRALNIEMLSSSMKLIPESLGIHTPTPVLSANRLREPFLFTFVQSIYFFLSKSSRNTFLINPRTFFLHQNVATKMWLAKSSKQVLCLVYI